MLVLWAGKRNLFWKPTLPILQSVQRYLYYRWTIITVVLIDVIKNNFGSIPRCIKLLLSTTTTTPIKLLSQISVSLWWPQPSNFQLHLQPTFVHSNRLRRLSIIFNKFHFTKMLSWMKGKKSAYTWKISLNLI